MPSFSAYADAGITPSANEEPSRRTTKALPFERGARLEVGLDHQDGLVALSEHHLGHAAEQRLTHPRSAVTGDPEVPSRVRSA